MYDYDEQIQYLTELPVRIHEHWRNAKGLFKFAGCPSSEEVIKLNLKYPDNAGCLTMIRDSVEDERRFIYINGIPDYELTKRLMEDERIPKSNRDITVEHLLFFKEWQELIDRISIERMGGDNNLKISETVPI